MLHFSYTKVFSFLMILFVISSCIPMKNIVYMKNNPILEKEITTTPPVHQLAIGDILFIKVISLNNQSYAFFNVETNTNAGGENITMANLYINGFRIDDAGMIELPVIGRIYLLGQNIDQSKRTIQKAVDEYLKDATVIVKLANFEITVLGEVNRPGLFPIMKDNITIYDALAMAGDLTDYANRKKVKIVRTEDNKKKIYNIDVTDQQLLLSEFYYLRNDDLVYVEPLRYRSFRKSQSQVVFSTLTTLAIVLNVLLKLNE